ncbi:DNA alkylation repair protein [Candidatus Thioglobus sp.]|nr:DNA alkylation repair protein [Candidatus Thioglobus sp.]
MSAKEVIVQLQSFANFERKKINERFFKSGPGQYSEHDQFIGVRVPQIRLIAKQHFKRIEFSEIDQLIIHPIHEVRFCALIILMNLYQTNNQEIVFSYYLENISSVNNWDLVDTTVPAIIGDYLLNHSTKTALLFKWAASDDLWKRRIAIVATFAFIRQNQFKLTLSISKILLKDKEDLIHKAVGWMLREVYKKDLNICTVFLRENYAQLPRTTLRYAIERMPEIDRKAYLKGTF